MPRIVHLKGMEKFREKLPGYPGRRIFLFLIYVICSFLIGLVILISLDILPRLFPSITLLTVIEPFLPIIGVLLCEIIAFLCIFTVWHKRDKYKRKYKNLAYQRGIKFGIIGLPILFAIMVHFYIPLEVLPPTPPLNQLTITFSSSLFSFIPETASFDLIFRIIASLFFLILGALTIRCALFTFGIDYMAIVYLYYPEESEVQHHKIYSILRHPTYAAFLLICSGGLFARFSLYALIFFGLICTGLFFHIHFVEEKELITRFGNSYVEYKKSVPALIVRPRDIGTFLKLLFTFKERVEQ
ncbi:MAG: methyltransferase family protein [Candidatus Helarchaeota archaeon]